MIFFFLLITSAFSQDLGGLFRPGPSGHSALIRQQFYGDAKVEGSSRRLQQREWQARVNGTVYQDDGWELTAGLNAQDLVWHHPSPLFHPYRTFEGNVAARRFGKANQVRALSLSYGSASDRPFAQASNDTAGANYIHQFNEKWWGLVNWSNNRTFLNNVPLPGVFYVAEMSREKTLMVGLPAFVWRQRNAAGFEAQYFGFLPFNHRAHIGWFWDQFHGITLGYEHRPQVYLRDGRDEKRDRLFFVENRAVIEVQGAIKPQVLQWQIGVGTAFNRRVYEAENFAEDKEFDVPLGDTYFVSAQITSQF